MVLSLLPYELSEETDNDLVEIFDYSIEKFGVDQAIRYLNSFEMLFENLCLNPRSARIRNEIRNGLRSVSHVSHIVINRIMPGCIRIVRILHANREIIRFFPPND
jgi:toxin ParE1/3/4